MSSVVSPPRSPMLIRHAMMEHPLMSRGLLPTLSGKNSGRQSHTTFDTA